MGAWGTGVFDNDTANDWADDLTGSDVAYLADTLSRVLDGGDEYLDADVASEALAACEVVARLRGHAAGTESGSESADQWVAAQRAAPSEELVRDAVAAIDRVARAPSELLELWDEVPEGGEFRAVLTDLRARLVK
jgi:hypothetical protein